MPYPSEDYMKHRQGHKRQPRFGEWYENREAHKEAKKYFAASENGVPNNPTNYQSYTPAPAPVNPSGSAAGDYVFRRNPYGDGEQIVQQEGPTYSKPTQWGRYNEGSKMAPKADQQPIGPGWGGGPGTDMSPSRVHGGRGGHGGEGHDRGRRGRKGGARGGRKGGRGPRGMNTGIGGFGRGPQRDVPRKQK